MVTPFDEYDFDQAWYDCGASEFLAPIPGDAFRAACARTLIRLPSDVREFALERCSIFTTRRGQRAACWSGSRRKRWIIVANEDMRGDVESTIAHEIAHARLGHATTEPDGDNEREADDLITRWGFTRCYRRPTRRPLAIR